MMVFSAQLAEGGEWECLPTPFHSIYPFNWSSVSPSTPSPARLVRYIDTCTQSKAPLPFSLVITIPKAQVLVSLHFFTTKSILLQLAARLPSFFCQSVWFWKNLGWVLRPAFLLLSGCEGGGCTIRIDWWQWQGASEWVSRSQSTYFPRDETGLVCLPTQLERTLQLYWWV